MSNQSTSQVYVLNVNLESWPLQNFIFVYLCAPTCLVGVFLCASCAFVWHSADLKETLFVYLKLESILMSLNLATKFFNSLSSIYFCVWCTPGQLVACSILETYMFTFVPSILEATVLLTDLFVALSFLPMFSNDHNRFQKIFMHANPNLAVAVAFASCVMMFSYQLFKNSKIFHIDFIVQNATYLDIITFSIRDGLFLVLLLVTNGLISWKANKNLKKKMHIVNDNLKKNARRSQNRMTIMILADCTNSIVGRVPILCLFIIKFADISLIQIYPLTSICSLAVFLAYTLKFFIYFKFNKRFRLVFIQKMSCFKSVFEKNARKMTYNNSVI